MHVCCNLIPLVMWYVMSLFKKCESLIFCLTIFVYLVSDSCILFIACTSLSSALYILLWNWLRGFFFFFFPALSVRELVLCSSSHLEAGVTFFFFNLDICYELKGFLHWCSQWNLHGHSLYLFVCAHSVSFQSVPSWQVPFTKHLQVLEMKF